MALCLAAMTLCCMGQQHVEQHIQRIRQAYAQRLQLMQNQPYDDIAVEQMTVAYNRMYPGTGLYRCDQTYYWSDDGDEQHMLKPSLYFVTSQYSMNHGMYRFSREYLLDASTEEPLFLLVVTQLDDDIATRREYRFYFHNRQLIRQVPERIGPFGDAELPQPDFGVDERGQARAADLLAEFDDISKTFHSLVPTYGW